MPRTLAPVLPAPNAYPRAARNGWPPVAALRAATHRA